MMKNCKKLLFFMLLVMLTGCSRKSQTVVNGNTETDVVAYSSNHTAEPIADSLHETALSKEENQHLSKWEQIWYETKDYPLKYGDDEFDTMDWEERKEALNPPAELIENLSVEELADLSLRFPLFFGMPWYPDEEKEIQLGIYREYSRIFDELMKRENYIEAILGAYEQLELNVKAYENEEERITDESYLSEIFIEDFVLAYGKDFTEEQRQQFLAVVEKRFSNYYSVIYDCNLGHIAFDEEGKPYRRSFFYGVELPNGEYGGVLQSPYMEYQEFLLGKRNAMDLEGSGEVNILDILPDDYGCECTFLDLDEDGTMELLIQFVDDPCSYNGVFHYDKGEIICWNHDGMEGTCRDYPLRDGRMVRQYDYGGTSTYTIFRYQAGGERQELNCLFTRYEKIPEDDPAPCPYYLIDEKEVDGEEFDKQLDAMIIRQMLERNAWHNLGSFSF